MTLRRLLLVSIITFFCLMIYRTDDPVMVEKYVWAIVIVAMLPMKRLKADGIVNMIKAVKGGKDDT